MSDIQRSHVYSLRNLRIPAKDLFTPSSGPHPAINHHHDPFRSITVRYEGGTLTGWLDGTNFVVNGLQVYGENSGRLMDDVLIPALKKSTGTLTLIRVWGDGFGQETSDQLEVAHGEMKIT